MFHEQIFMFDYICERQECVKNGKGLFHIGNDAYHTDQHYSKTRPIKAKPLKEFFDVINSQNMKILSFDKVIDKLSNVIDENCLKIQKFIREHFFKKIINKLLQTIDCANIGDIDNLIDKLKMGNDQILKKKLLFERSSNGTNFPIFLKQQVEKDEQQMQFQVQEISSNIVQMLQAFEIEQIKQLMNNFNQRPQNNTMFRQEMSNQMEEHFQNPNQQHQQNHNQTDSNRNAKRQTKQRKSRRSNKYIFSLHKKKQIKKIMSPNALSSKIARAGKSIHIKTKLQISSQQFEQQIIIANHNSEIIVKSTNNPQQTIKYLQKHCPKLKQMHIFDVKFSKRDTIISIFKKFIEMHTLTFNCNHYFDIRVANSLEVERLEKIKHLELKWGFDRFFNQYSNLQYFNQKKIKDMTNLQNIQKLTQIYKKFKNTETLLFQNQNQFKQLQWKSFQKITVLHLINGGQQFNINGILTAKQLTNLTTLNLERVTISLSDQSFQYCISNNKQLRTIRLICLKIIGNIDDLLLQLQSLPFLKQLTLQSQKVKSMKINPSYLFNLIHLHSLILFNITFKCNDDPQDSFCLREIRKLKQLTHLGLLSSWPVCNDIFSYLQEGGILVNIKFLGLYGAFIDSNCKKYISKMISLEQLQIQQVDISGEDLAQAFQQMYLKNKKFSKLKYLHANQYDFDKKSNLKDFSRVVNKGRKLRDKSKFEWRHSVSSIKKLAAFTPHLKYLNIQKCYNLKDYNFQDFKSLQMLCVDSQLKAMLPEISKQVKVYVGLQE